MATPLVLNSILQARIITTLDAQTAYNVSHWKVTLSTGTGVTPLEAITQLRTNLLTAWPAILATLCSWRGIGGQQATVPKDAETFIAGPIAGNSGGVPLPKQVCGVLSFYDGFAGRKHRGRAYLPFPSQSDNTTDGVPTAGYLTRAGAVMTVLSSSLAVIGAGGTAALGPCIFHRLTQTADLIQRQVVRTIWGTQRKRGDYGRTNSSPI